MLADLLWNLPQNLHWLPHQPVSPHLIQQLLPYPSNMEPESIKISAGSRLDDGSSTVVGSAAKDGVDKARGYRPDALSHTATPDRGAIGLEEL